MDDDGCDTGFHPIEVVREGDDFIVLRQWYPLFDDFLTNEIFFEADCYYVMTGKPPFREYFYRVESGR